MQPLPHEFRDPSLLARALTHASTASSLDNERLEFLGDAVLGLIAAHELHRIEPALSEGQLSTRKAWLVSRPVLAAAAHELGLGARARLGAGLLGGELPVSVLANLYEAVLGAIYLDAGLEAAQSFVRATLAPLVAAPQLREQPAHPKQQLQELCQIEGGRPPLYELLEERGLPHARAFCVRARIGDRVFAPAWGRTVKEAERAAAAEALRELGAAVAGQLDATRGTIVEAALTAQHAHAADAPPSDELATRVQAPLVRWPERGTTAERSNTAERGAPAERSGTVERGAPAERSRTVERGGEA